MISLVWGYWNRQAVADRSCELLAQHYAGLDLELIVVDDGNAEPYRAPAMPFPVTVVRLPMKTVPLNPCVPLNRGVAVSRGEFIALSGPEMMHNKPILDEMRAEIDFGGKNTYVVAAAWFAEGQTWHVHSSISGEPVLGVQMPKGSHYHFMSMLSRELWNRTGGFDEDYRNGTGYDDPDFVKRLERAGARFVLRDDLVVEHVREGARAAWTKKHKERNKALFRRKWA